MADRPDVDRATREHVEIWTALVENLARTSGHDDQRTVASSDLRAGDRRFEVTYAALGGRCREANRCRRSDGAGLDPEKPGARSCQKAVGAERDLLDDLGSRERRDDGVRCGRQLTWRLVHVRSLCFERFDRSARPIPDAEGVALGQVVASHPTTHRAEPGEADSRLHLGASLAIRGSSARGSRLVFREGGVLG
jgi:hypothetical protein